MTTNTAIFHIAAFFSQSQSDGIGRRGVLGGGGGAGVREAGGGGPTVITDLSSFCVED